MIALTRLTIGCFLMLPMLACTAQSGPSSLSAPEKAAVCEAQSYLRKNGYLEELGDPSKIELQMWDKITYQKDGTMDWTSLLEDRRGSYVNRLYGVARSGSDYLVVYRVEGGKSCIRYEPSTGSAHKLEANCEPKAKDLSRVSEAAFTCGS